MTSTTPQNISEAIIVLFAEKRDWRADELHNHISTRFIPCSSRAIYKELSKLITRGIVIKVKDLFSLSITWILNSIQFAESLYNTSVAKLPRKPLLPNEGEKMRWHFHDLLHLDRFWLQLIFLLFEKSKSRTMFVWAPCFWFDLIHFQKDLEAMKAMRIAKNRMYMIIGSRTFLDLLPQKYWSKEVYTWSYAPGPF